MNSSVTDKILSYENLAWLLMTLLLFAAIRVHLLPALFAGLLVFELIHILSNLISYKGLSNYKSKVFVVAFLAFVVVLSLSLIVFAIIGLLRSGYGNLATLLQNMADIVEGSLKTMPAWLMEYMPPDVDALKAAAALWLRRHSVEIGVVGKEAVRMGVYVLVGMVIGALIALEEVKPVHEYLPFSRALIECAAKVKSAFRRVVFAQVRISAINTLFTMAYLLVVLPLLGVHLPFAKTILLITFIAGLLPVVGNLISNTVIVIVSFSQSLGVVFLSLGLMVVMHKFEYFLNARIVGTQIQSKTWEILLSMLVMEALFGIPGVIAAPVYYAYLKDELVSRKMV